MKFSGSIENGGKWGDSGAIDIAFDSVEELEKTYLKYLKVNHAVVRTPNEAKPGDQRTLVYTLPNGAKLELQGEIEKVKEQPGKSFTVSLFKLTPLSLAQHELVAGALKANDGDLDLDDDMFTDMITQDYAPPKESEKPAAPAKAAKSERSEEDEQRVRAMLAEDEPDEDVEDIELPEELRGASGDLIMPKKEGEEEDPHLEKKKYIIAFILTFTKSVQRSGYYGDGDHPESKKAKKGLYPLFRKIVGRRRELNFIRKAIAGDRDVLIDGVLPEMVELSEIMPHGMAELYIPRFLEYLERRCLISLSIKRIINEEKFHNFIDLLSQYSPAFKDDSRKEGERFTRTLVEHNIVEVSAVFDEDIISSGRKLPWQAELTLSRLKKDLKTVPLLKNATEEELRDIKIRIFQDTIRPLRNPTFMIAVLLNADLIMEGIEENQILADINVEEFMIRGAELEFLASVSLEIIKELEGVRELRVKAPLDVQRKQAEQQEKVLMRIIAHISDRFLNERSDASDEALEDFFARKLITFKGLPVRVQERIANKKLTEAFLKNSDEIIDRFNSHLSDKEFSDFINRFQRVIPLLSDRREYRLVGRLIDSARKHLDDRDVRRKSLTKRLFDFISTTDVLKNLKDTFKDDDRELRTLAASVFVSFGRQAVPMLLEILKESEDKWVRKQMIRSLIDVGPIAIQPMINELYKEDNPWYFLRNIINILGELGDRKIIGKMTLLLYHENPSIREETVATLARLAPDVAETHLIKMLDDQDARVRERAISSLGMIHSTNDKVLTFYMDVLEGRTELENEALQVQVYRALGQLGELPEEKRKTIESILLKNLGKGYGANFLIQMFRDNQESDLSDSLKMAICTALGQIGKGRKVIKVLTKASREQDPVMHQRAMEALENIKKREAGAA